MAPFQSIGSYVSIFYGKLNWRFNIRFMPRIYAESYYLIRNLKKNAIFFLYFLLQSHFAIHSIHYLNYPNRIFYCRVSSKDSIMQLKFALQLYNKHKNLRFRRLIWFPVLKKVLKRTTIMMPQKILNADEFIASVNFIYSNWKYANV